MKWYIDMDVNTLDQAWSSEARRSSLSSKRCGTPTSRWSSQTSELAPEDQLHQLHQSVQNWIALHCKEIFAANERRNKTLVWYIIIIIVNGGGAWTLAWPVPKIFSERFSPNNSLQMMKEEPCSGPCWGSQGSWRQTSRPPPKQHCHSIQNLLNLNTSFDILNRLVGGSKRGTGIG